MYDHIIEVSNGMVFLETFKKLDRIVSLADFDNIKIDEAEEGQIANLSGYDSEGDEKKLRILLKGAGQSIDSQHNTIYVFSVFKFPDLFEDN